MDNSPRPLWAQRLAAGIVRERPRLVPDGRHVGQLVTGLMNLALPIDVTARELFRTIDLHARPSPSGQIADPLAWFLHQVRTIVAHLFDARDWPTRPREHVHDHRAILSPTLRGCLTCPHTITLTERHDT